MRGNLLIVRDWGSARLEILEQLLLYWHHYFLSLSLSLSLSPASALTLWIWIDPLKALRHTDSNAHTELEAWKALSEVWGLVSRWACLLQPAWILDSYGIDTSCGAWRREPTASATYCGTDSLSGALRAAWSIPEPTIFKWAKLIQGPTLNTEPLQNRTHFLFFFVIIQLRHLAHHVKA